MNSLKLYLFNTKPFKKISICFCSLLMVFASVFCPYSEVKALVGVDDAFYAYAFVTALGVLGIGLASTDASRDAVVDVGTKAYNSFKKYVPMIGQAAVTNVTNFFNFCKDTGKIALDKLDGIKGDIMKWFIASSVSTWASSDILKYSGLNDMGIENLEITYTNNLDDLKSRVPEIYHDLCKVYDKKYSSKSGASLYIPIIDLFVLNNNKSYDIGFMLKYYFGGLNLVNAYGDSSSLTSNGDPSFYTSDGNKFTSISYTNAYKLLDSLANYKSFSIVSSGIFGISNMNNDFKANFCNNIWNIISQGTLELDPPNKVTDSFKLDDRVLGQDNTLDLTDTIVGAVGSLTLDKTKDVTTTLGTLDIPDTAIDFPYTGTWDNTLGKIGAIAWNPDIDVPIADTKIIAPTVTPDGKPNTDKKVDDFDGEGGQLSFDWKNVFPFCIPFDMIKFIQCLCADPVAPVVDIPVNIPNIYKGNINVNLKQYDDVAKLCRTLFDLLFILGLAYTTRYLIKG